MRNKFIVYKPHSLCYFVIAAQMDENGDKPNTHEWVQAYHSNGGDKSTYSGLAWEKPATLPRAVTLDISKHRHKETGKHLSVPLIRLVEGDQETFCCTQFISWPHSILVQSCSRVIGHSTENCFQPWFYQLSSSISSVTHLLLDAPNDTHLLALIPWKIISPQVWEICDLFLTSRMWQEL